MQHLKLQKDEANGFFIFEDGTSRETWRHTTPIFGDVESAMEHTKQCLCENGAINLDLDDFPAGDYSFAFLEIQTENAKLTEESQKKYHTFIQELTKKNILKERAILYINVKEIGISAINSIIESMMHEFEDSSIEYVWGLAYTDDGAEGISLWLK